MPLHTRRATCRLCRSPDLEVVLQLEPSALAEAYLPPERASGASTRYPLDLALCHACGGVQVLDVLDAGHLFSEYAYASATSPGLAAHFERYARDVVARFNPRPRDLVVDVGSNDGTLLKHFQSWGLAAVGVEPSRRLALAAGHDGVAVVCTFLNEGTGREIADHYGHAQLVTANNVLAHAEEPGTILDGIRAVLADDGVLVFEVSYLPALLRGLVLDYVYHEHGIFFGVTALASWLGRHGLHLFDAHEVPTKGGSLRGFAQHAGGPRPESAWVRAGAGFPRQEERAAIYEGADVYRAALARFDARRDQLLAHLDALRAAGKQVAGYGASATVTTLLHHFKLGDKFDFLVDDNPQKHGLVSPGHALPVLPAAALYERRPDAVVVLAWRFADSILRAHPDASWEWLVPLPEFRTVRGGAGLD